MFNKHLNRRQFFRDTTLGSFSFLLGTPIVFAHFLPKGLIPIALLEQSYNNNIEGKDDRLTVLNDRPVNAETPPHLLNDPLTPNNLFFVRNNGIPPTNIDAQNWTLTIEGESAKQKRTFSLQQLQSEFTVHSYHITLECGGNGRKEFNPPAKGNQWSLGAVGCAKWTGVRLGDVLKAAGIKDDARYIGYYGADGHLSGAPDKVSISRGVPIKKALEPESLIAWSMNDEDLPLHNGYPLRLIFGGYPASASGKWLKSIAIRNIVHDGPKMDGQSYRVPCEPVAPGAKVIDEDMCIIERMPVKSLISFPKSGASIKQSQSLPIQGHAWAGAREVQQVSYSIDFGQTWSTCKLTTPGNRFAWQQFSAKINFPKPGYYEVWARATDDQGESQPMLVPGWNPKGYLNNACHRIAVKVTL